LATYSWEAGMYIRTFVIINIIFIYSSFILSASVHIYIYIYIYSVFFVKSGFLLTACREGTEGGVEL